MKKLATFIALLALAFGSSGCAGTKKHGLPEVSADLVASAKWVTPTGQIVSAPKKDENQRWALDVYSPPVKLEHGSRHRFVLPCESLTILIGEGGANTRIEAGLSAAKWQYRGGNDAYTVEAGETSSSHSGGLAVHHGTVPTTFVDLRVDERTDIIESVKYPNGLPDNYAELYVIGGLCDN